MRWFALGLIASILPSSSAVVKGEEPVARSKVVMVLHGGSGPGPKSEMPAEREKQCRATLEEALFAGHKALKAGKPSLDAVEVAIKVMEDSSHFNAGKGAVFTHEERNELDASIMDGGTLKAGAVAGVTVVKNPISAARTVMRDSPHVMMVGKGAEEFVKLKGLEIVDPKYFWTQRRFDELQKAIKEEKAGASLEGLKPYFGTVGAVALDRNGHLAAGTSTGGMTNKRNGRVGDSPIIGAGCYADDATCAVSSTGHGEYFIRYVVAYDIAALMRYKGLSVEKAAEEVVNVKLKKAGGEGGVIALDARGNCHMPYNSEGMYRGYITEDGAVHIAIYED